MMMLEPRREGRDRERGHALVVSHDDSARAAKPRSIELLPGPLVYLRLRGSRYTPAALRSWREKVQAAGADRAFVFFKHEDAGQGARMAETFLREGAAPARAPRRKAVDSGTGTGRQAGTEPAAAKPASKRSRPAAKGRGKEV